MRLKKIISLSLALLTGISVLPMRPFAASSGEWKKTEWSGDPGSSSVISQGDIYYLEKKGSSVYPEKYKFKADGSDGDGIPTNSQKVMQDGKIGPIVKPWEQFYDGLTPEEKDQYILVRDKITITKKDKKGNPLSGIQFKLAYKEIENKNDGSKKYEFYKDSTNSEVVYTTDEHGQCTITFPDNKWGPMYLVETVPTESGKPKYKNKTIKLYRDPGTRFLGEVSGQTLGITYKLLRDKVGEGIKPQISRSMAPSIYDQDANEENVDGIWLKFIDRDQFGRIHVFYIAKRPVLKGISWNDIHSAGMVYGWDVINPHTKEPKTNSENYKNIGNDGTGKDYKATILTNKQGNKEYIVRLLQGKTNYGGNVTNQGLYMNYNDNNSSEWNRVILPLVQGYRFGEYTDKNKYSEDVLRQSDGNLDYSSRKYTTNTARYNWFGDLTLGSYDKFTYNEKEIKNGNNSTKFNGQFNWTQEYLYHIDYRSYRGSIKTHSGAAQSYNNSANYGGSDMGFRPVLEVAPKEYDDVVFEGEVTGKELGITYDELRKKVRDKTNKTEETLPKPSITKEQSKLLHDLNDYEEKNGGMWLKFTDYKYTRDGKPRTFYVAKKPILKNISYDDIVNSGMAYGWDTIDSNTRKPRSNLTQSDKNALQGYNPTIIPSNNQQYIVRLLHGEFNYDNHITENSNNQGYDWQNSPNSEWNRTIVAITKQYRGDSNSMEQALKDGNSGTQWVNNNYKNQTAQYNWFGDLTLGAEHNFNYDVNPLENITDSVNQLNSVGYQGQWSWTQKYAYSRRFSTIRGSSTFRGGAAGSLRIGTGRRHLDTGFRPVLEPLNN